MLSEIITWHTLIFLQVRKVWVKPHFPENLQRQYFANIPVGMRVTPAIIVKESPVIISQIYFLYCLRETVRSRCQIIRFSPLSVAVVKNILVNQFKLDNKQAERLAFISNGSIERATLLSGTHALEKKNWLVDRLLKLEINDNLTFSKELFNEWHIQDLDILEEKRSHVKELLFSFLMYYRDLLVCKIGSDNLPIYHTDWRDALALTVCFFTFLCRKVDAFDSGGSPGRGNDTLMMIAFNQCAPRNTEIPVAIIYRIHGVRCRLFNPVCAEEWYLNSVLGKVANTDPYQSYGLLESYCIEYLFGNNVNVDSGIHIHFHGVASCKGSEIRVAQGKGNRPARISSA